MQAFFSGTRSPEPRRVALLGGTFDPPHIGHLVLADQTLDQLGVDEVWLVVSNQPWQKVGSREITPAPVRLELVEAAVAGRPGLTASAVEIELGGPSYTFDTLDALHRDHPDDEFSLVMGIDAAAGLDTWHRAEELRDRCRIVVANRPGADDQPLPEGWTVDRLAIPALDVSSTELRQLVAAGRSIRYLTPDGVIQRLDRAGLYRQRT
ncbi:MAG: nicotinate-nucleotide adenylyltransferase [Acidimicrobiales bacterium]